jgi:nucleoside-diphosphate-sugar epimerase
VLAAGLPAGAGQIFNLLGVAPVRAAEFFTYHMRWAGRSGPPRTLSTEMAIRIATLASLLGRLLGKPTEASRQTMLMLSKNHPMSMQKAQEMLGYAPKIDLAEGMRRTELWLREQGLISA